MDGQTIRSMTVTELKEKLKELNLDTSGRKQTLCGRLMDHLGVGCSDDESTNSDYTEATAGKQLSKNYERVNFTLRDIEDSVTSFSGDDHYDVSHWVREFEDIADTVGWSDLQKFVYAKQLLRGAAQLFVRGLVGIRSWPSLKEKLIDEFGKQLSAAEIHRIMRQRHKRPKESLNEYLYALIEIGNPIKLDEASVIEYFIDGIPDSRLNKAMLYEATTLKVLKEKIKIFDKIRGNFSSSNKTNPTNITNEHRPREDKKACFKCGSNTHLARECNRQGIVCFNCKQKGHFAKDCKDKPTKQVVKSEHVNILGKTLSKGNPKSNMIFTNIKIKDKTFNALVDTGSELCIIRYDMVKMIGDVELKNEIVHLSGIGEGRLTTLGCFDAEIKLDDIIIKVTFYVVTEKDMVYSAILGSSIFEKVDMVIGQAGATFKKKGLLGSLKAVESTQNWGKPNPDVDWFDEFSALCCINIDGGVPNCPVNLTHLPKSVALTVEYWIRNFKPNKIAKSPIEMRIIVKDDIPVYQTPRRMSFGDRKFINEQIDLWLKDGILVPSTSEYAAPVVLVSKKDGTKRLCCDYRKINEKIVRDNFPMTLIDEVLEQLQGANIFTTLDLANRFFHVPIEPSSRKYTAFVTHGGQFEFCYAPFGICNSPAVFGRYIQAVFRDLLKEGTVVIYMDDIVIPAKGVDEGMVKLKKVLEVATRYGLKIKWEKCQFLEKQITFLGYVIKDGKILPSEGKTKAIRDFPVPKNKKEMQRFLGLTSYFRRFINKYAEIAKPLSDLLRKDAKFVINEDQILAMKELKQRMVVAPALKLYNPQAVTEIHTDASKYGYGAVLLQKDSEDESFHPVEYLSRKTTPCEEKYCSYELEVLAIIQALKKWRVYLKDVRFKIVTDCNAFAMTMKKGDIPDRVMRWSMYLQQFDYTIEHRGGTRMKHVDALSRVYCLLLVEDSLKCRLKEAQCRDDWIRAVKKVLEKDVYDDYYEKNQLLYKDPNKELLVVPTDMEEEIIKIAHRQGHIGAKKTQELLQNRYFIPKLGDKVNKVVKSCVECLVIDAKAGKKEGLLTPIDKSSEPLGTYHIDHVGPLSETRKQYNHILVVVDGFSKFVWLYPTKSTGTEEVIERLRKQAASFGNPKRIVTDRGAAFTSLQFKKYCTDEGIQHLLIATGVPRGNGQVERMHRIIVPMVSKLCQSSPTQWYRRVEEVQRAINNTPPRSTKLTPFKILTGLDMRTAENPDLRELLENAELYELDEQREQVRSEARKNIEKIQEENRKYFNRNRQKAKKYKVGDLVAIKRTQFGVSMKLRARFFGPYKVTDILNHDRYSLEKVGEHEGPIKTISVAEFMKPWGPIIRDE